MQANMSQLTGVDQCIRVHGFEEAKAYSMGPSCRAPLFDDTDDIVYIKSTDQNGFPSIKRFRLTEEVLVDPNDAGNGVSLSDIRSLIREELSFMKEEILNAQQPISEPAINVTNATQSSEYDRSSANAKHHGNNQRNRQQRANTPNVADGEKQQEPTGRNAAIGE